jgi:alpha-1,2-mannosyltransferase
VRPWVPRALTEAGLCLVGIALLGPWGPRMLDLDVYRSGAHALLTGVDVYATKESTTGLPFTYPIFAAMVFAPLAVMPTMLARPLMLGVSLAALVLISAVTLRRGLGWDRARTRTWCGPVAIASVIMHPVLDTLLFGQVNLVLVAMILADLFLVRRRYSGILIGLAAGIKLTPGLFIVYLLVTGQRRQARNGVVAFVGTVLLGLLAQPAQALSYWTTHIFDPGRTGNVLYTGNQSVLATTARLLREPQPPTLLAYGFAAAVVVAALVVARALHRRDDTLMAVCVIAVATLLASPISWTHHWVWCVPCLGLVVAWAGRAAARAPRRGWLIGGFVVGIGVVVAAGITRFVPTNGLRELDHNLVQQAVANSCAFLALALLVWAAFRAFGPRRDGPPNLEGSTAIIEGPTAMEQGVGETPDDYALTPR